MSSSPTWTRCTLTLLLFLMVLHWRGIGADLTPTGTSFTILHDSRVPAQLPLLRSVFVCLRDAEVKENVELAPKFIDVATTDLSGVGKELGSQETEVILSLLNPEALEELSAHIRLEDESRPLRVFSPRRSSLSQGSGSISVTSLQMNELAVTVALLNRISRINTKSLIPVLDDQVQLEILELYRKEASNLGIFIGSPILLDDPQNEIEVNLQARLLAGHGNVAEGGVGVLLLATKRAGRALRAASQIFSSNSTQKPVYLPWFSPSALESLELIQESRSPFFGLYSVEYLGSEDWDNPSRTRTLRELSSFTGPSPIILSAVLAHDAATLAVHTVMGRRGLPAQGLSGSLKFDQTGHRSNGVFFGLSATPPDVGTTVAILQPSSWILEDLIRLGPNSKSSSSVPTVQHCQIATSSVLSREVLLGMAEKAEKTAGCLEHGLEVLTHDPFTQQPATYTFSSETLPEYLLIPNTHGYGLTFMCSRSRGKNWSPSDLVTTLKVACSPGHGSQWKTPLHCFRSSLHVRTRRSTGVIKDFYGPEFPQWMPRPVPRYSSSRRDDNSMNMMNSYFYGTPDSLNGGYYPAATMPTSAVYGSSSSETSTPGSMTTRLDVTINEEPSSTAAPAPGTSKLPELRQILKAAKPFVGSCIGATTGCAVCVLVLGRLPLGAVPAACTGPCFVGTFGSCGSLLGRVFAETTVICTELFRQGLLDMETFLADAEFGRVLADTSPEVLLGYQTLASPVVRSMKWSVQVSKVVSFVVSPWAHHMKFLVGATDSPSITGKVMHEFGVPVCALVGRIRILLGQTDSFHIGLMIMGGMVPLTFLVSRVTRTEGSRSSRQIS